MGVLSITKGIHVILTSTVFIFTIIVHDVAYGCIPYTQWADTYTEWAADNSLVRSFSSLNVTYIEIDHELIPRKIHNINKMKPLPVPRGRDKKMMKYKVSKRQIQDIFLELEESKGNNKPTAYFEYDEGGTWANESEIRKSKLKSVLGTDGKVYYDADWGLMSAVLTCYNNHWVLKTGPEDWWTVVIRRIVEAMDKDGGKPQVRNHFVEHKGKEKLEVNVGSTLSNINYNWLFSQFSNQIRDNIKTPGYVDIIENDFSSSTDEQIMISQIMLMSSVKKYFEFGIHTDCGIPGVEMKGTKEDWVKLVDKIKKLEALLAPINEHLHLTDWFKVAKKVFKNLLKTYNGNPNIKWWRHILSWNEEWGSGARDHWTGWFPEFAGAEEYEGRGNFYFGSYNYYDTDPNHNQDSNNEPPVEVDGILSADSPGFNMEQGGRFSEFVGSEEPEKKWVDFKSDLVTVPVHIEDYNNEPPVQDDGILIAGIVGFNVEEGVRAPVVEPKHAWGLLLPKESPVADRLQG